MEYVIVGDTKEYKGCLVYVCGKDINRANEVLDRLLNNPDKRDLEVRKDYTNFKIEEVQDKDCWWNGNLD